MSYELNVKKLIKEVRGEKGLNALREEADKIGAEVRKLQSEVEASVKPKAQAQIKKLEARYKSLLKTVQTTQKNIDKEVTKTATVVKKAAKDAEKTLNSYKKKAITEKNKLVARFSKKKAPKRKAPKTSAKKTVKTSKKSAQ
jgi:NAD-specific glutamate dehydrogenase